MEDPYVSANGDGEMLADGGTVDFTIDNTQDLGSETVTNGYATITVPAASLPAGPYTLTANYSGDAGFSPSRHAERQAERPVDRRRRREPVERSEQLVGRRAQADDAVALGNTANVTLSGSALIGSLELDPGATLTIQGGLTVGGDVNNGGGIVLEGNSANPSESGLIVGGALTNAGTITSILDPSSPSSGSTPRTSIVADAGVDNEGTISVDACTLFINLTGEGLNDTTAGGSFVNTGIIQLNNGGNCGIGGVASAADLGVSSIEGTGVVDVMDANWTLPAPSASSWYSPKPDSRPPTCGRDTATASTGATRQTGRAAPCLATATTSSSARMLRSICTVGIAPMPSPACKSRPARRSKSATGPR